MMKRPATYVKDQGELFLLNIVLLTIPIFKNVEWFKKRLSFPTSPQMFTTEPPVKFNSKTAQRR